MPPMVRLVPMTPDEVEEYLRRDLAVLARENVAAGYWGQAEAEERARKSQARTLPGGPATAGHHFFHIQDPTVNQKVGWLWLFEDQEARPPTGFIYDLAVEEPFWRRGYAEAALLALEAMARERGLESLGLHVFAHNASARRLYDKVGYTTRSLNMIKAVGRA